MGPPVDVQRIAIYRPPDPPEPQPYIEDEIRYEVPGLERARLRARISQVELAKELGVSKMTVNYWESKKRNPKRGVIIRIAEILGVDFEILVNNA